jgi:DHA1 family bicyclomycin/chloramphenicol resistance-like MFS transporter
MDRLRIQQKYLGAKGLVVLIALLSAFIPLSTDLYLPALPAMRTFFGVGAEKINLTLTAFFIFYALGTLIWGPLSDRYGRRPILIAGLGLYVAASVGCAFMENVNGLVLCRIFQALGGSTASVIATAIVKDVYSGEKRQSILAIVQTLVVIAPAVAPVLGAFLLKVLSWRGIFWALAIIGAAALAGAFSFEETIAERSSGMFLSSLGRLGSVLKNRGFTLLLVLFSLAGISFPAFIAASTYIYQDGFHLSGQVYSFYFAFNALGTIVGPMIFLGLSRRLHVEKIIWGGFGVVAISGLLVCLLGNLQPWIFALCFLPASIAATSIRPPSVNMMLEQQKGDTGSVSSLISSVGILVGSAGMQVISLPWGNTIIALGIMALCASGAALLAWPFVVRQTIRLPGPVETSEFSKNLDV